MNKIINNIFWLLFENGTRILLALFLNGMLARVLSLEQYGSIQYILSIILIFSSMSLICGAEVVVPMLVNAGEVKVRSAISNIFWLRLFFSFIAYIAFVSFFYVFNSNNLFWVACVMGLMIIFGEPFAIINAWLQAKTNSRPRSIIIIIGSFLKCSVIGFFILFNISNIELYSFAWLFEAAIIAVSLSFYYWKRTGYVFNEFSFYKVSFYLRKGFPFFVGLLMMYLFLRLDIVFLKCYTNLEVVALYSAANQLITAISVIAPILSMSIAPSLIYRSNVTNVEKKIFFISVGMALVSILIAMIFSFLSDFLISIIFGDLFKESSVIFSYMLWGMVLYFINEGLNVYFIKLAEGNLIIIKWLFILIFSSVAYFILIPMYSYLGAIIGYAIGNLVGILYSIYILFLNSRKLEIY